jgi:hypothetical protein
MTIVRSYSLAALLLGLAACRSQPSEAAPAPARFELIAAPPGARGARAAGTDAAPPLPSELAAPDPDEPTTPDEEDDGGADVPDAATAAPDDGGVAL